MFKRELLCPTWQGRLPNPRLTGFKVQRTHPLGDDVKGRDEELVTDERERVEHVDDADDVKNDGALAQLVLREQVRREQSVVLSEKDFKAVTNLAKNSFQR